MKHLVLFLILVFGPLVCAWSQNDFQRTAKDTTTVVDSLYREDQFYLGLTYNLIFNVPDQVKQRGFSGGFRAGFIRDMPINAKRTVALGVGLGLGFNRFGSTLAISEDTNGQTQFTVLDEDVTFESNRFSTSSVEVPIEFRWRNSTPTSYKFYRIYGGVNISYHYANRATFVQDGTRSVTRNISEFNPLQLEATMLFGYNTINFYVAYALTPFFDDTATINEQIIGFQPFKLGIHFYFL